MGAHVDMNTSSSYKSTDQVTRRVGFFENMPPRVVALAVNISKSALQLSYRECIIMELLIVEYSKYDYVTSIEGSY